MLGSLEWTLIIAFLTSLLYLMILRSLEITKESWRYLIITLMVGATVSVMVSVIIEDYLLTAFSWSVLMFASIAAPLVEEMAKSLPVIFLPRRAIDERVDGIIYGGATGLGFAFIETVLYATFYAPQWQEVLLLRGIFSTPLHMIAGALFGYGIASLRLNKGNAIIWLALGVGFHMAFNFVVVGIESYMVSMVALVGIVVIGIYLLFAVIDSNNKDFLLKLYRGLVPPNRR